MYVIFAFEYFPFIIDRLADFDHYLNQRHDGYVLPFSTVSLRGNRVGSASSCSEDALCQGCWYVWFYLVWVVLTSRSLCHLGSISDLLASHLSILAKHIWGCQRRMISVGPDLLSLIS